MRERGVLDEKAPFLNDTSWEEIKDRDELAIKSTMLHFRGLELGFVRVFGIIPQEYMV